MPTRRPKSGETDAVKLLLAYLCVKDVNALGDKVATLERFGLSDSELAQVCDVDEKAIRDARYQRKKKNAKPAKAHKERKR